MNTTNAPQVPDNTDEWLQSDCSFEDDTWEESDLDTSHNEYTTDGLIKRTDQLVVIDKTAWDSFVEFSMKNSLNIRKVESTNEILAYEELNTCNLSGPALMWYNSSSNC